MSREGQQGANERLDAGESKIVGAGNVSSQITPLIVSPGTYKTYRTRTRRLVASTRSQQHLKALLRKPTTLADNQTQAILQAKVMDPAAFMTTQE